MTDYNYEYEIQNVIARAAGSFSHACLAQTLMSARGAPTEQPEVVLSRCKSICEMLVQDGVLQVVGTTEPREYQRTTNN